MRGLVHVFNIVENSSCNDKFLALWDMADTRIVEKEEKKAMIKKMRKKVTSTARRIEKSRLSWLSGPMNWDGSETVLELGIL